MKAALPGVLLVSIGMGALVAQTNTVHNQASERIDRTIVRKVDLTRDGRPEEIVLHVVGKDIKSPFSWTLEVLSKGKRIFYMTEKGDAEHDGIFGQPWYMSDCNDYESCKKDWYFGGILRTFLRPFNEYALDNMSGISGYPCTTFDDIKKMIVGTNKATLSQAQKIIDKLRLDLKKGRVVGIDLDVNPIVHGRCAIWIPVIDDFVIIYYTD